MKKAKLIKVSFIPTDNTVAAIIYALVDDISIGYKSVISAIYSNWTTDNRLNWEKSELDRIKKTSGLSVVGVIELEEAYSDFEEYSILDLKKIDSYIC